jgi:hypothetical protein
MTCVALDLSFLLQKLSRKPQKVEDQSATGLLLRTYSAGPVVSDLLSRSKRPIAATRCNSR